LGTIRSVEYTLQHLEELAANLTQNIADTRKRLADTQAQVDAPFEYADRLASLARRQQEIEDELDLTKGQASSQLDADPSESPSDPEDDANPRPDPN
jgi:predicted  nucleic acid-binding Zn-ribbon protein